MSEQRYVDFIENIIMMTKERKIEWRYLDGNQKLYEGMKWTITKNEYVLFSGNKEIVSPDFNVEDSFYANVEDTYLVIYVWKDQPAELYVVPNTYKKVVTLTPDEYGEHITRLLNIVQSQFPSGEGFIDGILSTRSEP